MSAVAMARARKLVVVGMRLAGHSQGRAEEVAAAAWSDLFGEEVVHAADLEGDFLYDEVAKRLDDGRVSEAPRGWRLRAEMVLKAEEERQQTFISRGELALRLQPIVAKWDAAQLATWMVWAATTNPRSAMVCLLKDAGLDPAQYVTDVEPVRVVVGVSGGLVQGSSTDAPEGEVEVVVADYDLGEDPEETNAATFYDPTQKEYSRAALMDVRPEVDSGFVWAAFEAKQALDAKELPVETQRTGERVAG